ncbi:MAG: DeoR/GlpR transcriptional regulator [Ruminococcaceae bacterium]|nr:DeoR/GlpR transcriptional regulator [Oscillospiraceae bacterium]
MSQKLRQEQILHILQKRGYVTVRYLTQALHYSSATINRDLNTMQTLGLVKRTYGGVEAVDRNHFFPLPQRQLYMKKEKRRNAQAAAELIQNGDTVFLDGSTSVQYIAPFLAQKRDLRVITNNLRLAIELGEYDMEVICLGGRISERPHVLFGEETVENALRYHPDVMFFSINEITADGRVRADGGCHYLLYRAMLKNSKKRYLLTDHSKLVERVKRSLCDFGALTGVISDFEFPEETKKAFPDTAFICVTE